MISVDFSFDHETTINHAEIVAIKIAFNSIINNVQHLSSFSRISIFTDSLFCLRLFTDNGYPSLRLYYDELIHIFEIITRLQQQFHISSIKVNSHTDTAQNEEVDTRAKDAAEQAILIHKIGNFKTPLL